MFQNSSPAPVSDRRSWSPYTGVTAGRDRVAVLLNANAKRVNASVRRDFERLVPRDDLFFSTSLDEAGEMCRSILERRYDVVMAGGGDGTIIRTMNELIRSADAMSTGLSRPPLPDIGVLRLGTGNALAAATGAGRPHDDIARVIKGRRPRARPLSLIEDREDGDVCAFGSIGYDAQLLNDYLETCAVEGGAMSAAMKKTLAGYFYALFTRTIPQQVSSDTPRVRVVATGRASFIDPETLEEVPLPSGATLFEGPARAVAWATTPYYGFKMKIFPHAERRSDRFQLRVATASIKYLLGHLPSLWDGTIKGAFVDFLVEGVRIDSSSALPYQVGGDGRGYRQSLDIRLSPRTFRILDHLSA